MKNKFALLICILAFTGLQADDSAEPHTGTQLVKEIEDSYRQGQYDAFLKGLNTEFERAGKSGLLKTVFEKMKKGATHKLSSEKAQELLKERNQKLLALCAEHPELDISKRIESIAHPTLDEEHEKALSEIEALRYELSDSKEISVKDALAAIETQSRLKNALYEVAAEKSGSDFDTRMKKKAVLALEKLEKMQRVAEKYNDPAWIDKVKKARLGYEADLVRQIDWEAVKDLTSGKTSPQNDTEKKVVEVMRDYFAKRDAK